jgi:hypothetical protein
VRCARRSLPRRHSRHLRSGGCRMSLLWSFGYVAAALLLLSALLAHGE